MVTAKEISDFVDANCEECVGFLQEILRTASPTGDEKAVSEVFRKKMESAGLKVDSYEAQPGRPNLLAEWFGTREGKRFVFNGHMDVFPPVAGDPGKYGPWSGTIAEGYIYGRGAADMKGGDAAAMMATLLLKRMGFDPKGSVLLSWMVDEERGSRYGVNYLLSKGLLKGDFGLCMEPTCGRVIRAHGGIIRGYVTYRSLPYHCSTVYPYGADALEKAVRVLTELYKIRDRLYARPDPVGYPKAVLSMAVLHAGEVANVHPSEATFWFDRRFNPGEDHDSALKEIVDVLESFKAKDPSYDYEMVVTNDRPILDVKADNPYLDIIQEAYTEVMGHPVEITTRQGGSDAGNINSANGLPIPNFGFADETVSGIADENFKISDYLDSIKVYMNIVAHCLK